MSQQPKVLKKGDRATQRRAERVQARMLEVLQVELQRGDVTAQELLAMLAYTTGVAIAYQDQTAMTPQMASELVSANIEAGNKAALETFADMTPMGSA